MWPPSRSCWVSPTHRIGSQADARSRPRPACDQLVALAEDVPALRVAQDDVGDAERLEHRGRDLAGERALVLEVHVLRAQRDRRSGQRLRGRRDRQERAARSARHDRARAPPLRGSISARSAQISCARLGRRQIHLPVAGKQSLAHRFRAVACASLSFSSALTPGSSIPSRYSRVAPPPVEICAEFRRPRLAGDRRRRVAAADHADDARHIRPSPRPPPSVPRAKAASLEQTQRPVPDHGLRAPASLVDEFRDRARSDIESHPIVRNRLHRFPPLPSVRARRRPRDRRQHQGHAAVRAASASSSRASSSLSSSTRDGRSARRCALEERVGHRAADQDRVDLGHQVADDADLVGDLGAAENRDVWMRRIVRHRAQAPRARASSGSPPRARARNGSRPTVEACARCAVPNASLT